jgi:hypothetical protein
MAIKRENDEFLASPPNRVPSVTGLTNSVGTPKQSGIAHEKAIKCENDKFLAASLKPYNECHQRYK